MLRAYESFFGLKSQEGLDDYAGFPAPLALAAEVPGASGKNASRKQGDRLSTRSYSVAISCGMARVPAPSRGHDRVDIAVLGLPREDFLRRLESATSSGGSPGRRVPIRSGMGRPVARRQASITSRTL